MKRLLIGPSAEPPEKILVIKLGALGDFVQALGPMAAIRHHHPDVAITLLTTEPFVTLGRECGYFNHIRTDDRPGWLNIKGWLALRRDLNAGGFSRVYDLQNNDRTSLYLRLFRTKPEWVGAAKSASHRNDDPQRTAGNAFEGHVQTLVKAGINDVVIDDLRWVKDCTSALSIQGPYVLLIPGSSPAHLEKRWPANNFATLARLLYGWGYTPVIIGTAGEADLAETIRASCPKAVDLTGQTSFSDIVVLARRAAAAFGNDTGPMHLIGPTGCPTYVLFSRHSNPVRHAPLGPHVRPVVTDDLADLTPDRFIGTIRARDFRPPDQEF